MSTTASRLAGLVDKLQLLRPGVRIVVSTPVPIVPGDNTAGAHLVMPEYVPAVRAVVAAAGYTLMSAVYADAVQAALSL